MRTLREEALGQMLQSRLDEDLRTCGQTICVRVIDDVGYLIGWVDTDEQKAAAKMIAGGTSGLRIVIDRVRVRRAVSSVG